MINNINPYNKTEFKKIFEHTGTYKKLEQDFGKENLIWEKFFHNSKLVTYKDSSEFTPRAVYNKYCSMAVFYYLLPLLENEYDAIYDLGCGNNMFKSYLPKLVGVGAEKIVANKALINDYYRIKDQTWPDVTSLTDFKNLPVRIKEECVQKKLDISDQHYHNYKHFRGDVEGFVDHTYVSEHQDCFQSVFSICALHFHPLTMFKEIVLDFVSMVKTGGRGFLSLNLQRMIERESNLSRLFSTDTPTALQYDAYLRNELASVDLKFLILDIDLEVIDDSMDGNIRLVIEK